MLTQANIQHAALFALIFFSCCSGHDSKKLTTPAPWRNLEHDFRQRLNQQKSIYAELRSRFNAIEPVDRKENGAFTQYQTLRSSLQSFESTLVQASLLLLRHEKNFFAALKRRNPNEARLAIKSAEVDLGESKVKLDRLTDAKTSIEPQLLTVANLSEALQKKKLLEKEDTATKKVLR